MNADVPAGLPGPGWRQTLRLRRDPIGALRDAQRRGGDVFRVNLLPAGELVVVAEPVAGRHLLRFCAQAGALNAATLPLTLASRSVFTHDGPDHRCRRSAAYPPFAPAVTGRWVGALTAAMDAEIECWRRGRAVRLLARLRRVVADALLPVLIRAASPAQQAELVDAACDQMSGPVAAGIAALAPYRVTRPLAARALGTRRGVLSSLISAEITRRAGQHGATRQEPTDVLDGLLAAAHQRERPAGQLDRATIIDELTSLSVALIEVQAIALAWGLERLARHPQVAEHLCTAHAHDAGAYARAVACEVLRTRPPVIGAFRELPAPTEVCGHELPVGTPVMVALPLVQHDRSHYPDPGAFRPGRRGPGNTGAWLPFGAGPRECLGAELARTTLTTILPRVVSRTRLRPARPRVEQARLTGTLLVPDRLATVLAEPT